MFEDGVRALNVEERFLVRDLSEIVVDSLDGRPAIPDAGQQPNQA